jgi:hypothetical protein
LVANLDAIWRHESCSTVKLIDSGNLQFNLDLLATLAIESFHLTAPGCQRSVTLADNVSRGGPQ